MSERRSEQVAVRVAWGLAVAALTVPAMVIAHLVAAGTVPSPLRLAAVGALVAAITSFSGTEFGGTEVSGTEFGGTELGGTELGGTDRARFGPLGPIAVIFVAQLAGHAVFSPATTGGTGCLPVMGRGAEVGLRLALLRPDPTCPPGTLGLTEVAATTTSMLLAAVLVVIAHAITGAAGQLLVASTGRAWRVAGRLARTAGGAVAALGALVTLGVLPAGLPVAEPAALNRSRQPTDRGPRRLRTRWFALAGPRRGPPRLVVA